MPRPLAHIGPLAVLVLAASSACASTHHALLSPRASAVVQFAQPADAGAPRTDGRNSNFTVAAARRVDVPHIDTTVAYPRLTPTDFAQVASRARAMVVLPESLVVAAGERVPFERVFIYVIDSTGAVIGRTRWMAMSVPRFETVRFFPPGEFVAHEPGRILVRVGLPAAAAQMIGRKLPDAAVRVVVGPRAAPVVPVNASEIGGIGLR